MPQKVLGPNPSASASSTARATSFLYLGSGTGDKRFVELQAYLICEIWEAIQVGVTQVSVRIVCIVCVSWTNI